MKIKFLTFSILIIILLIFWFFLNKKEQPPRPINVVTKDVIEKPTTSKKPEKPRLSIQERQEAREARYQFLKEKQEREEPDLSYLQAYRDLNYYKYCSNVYNALEANQDPDKIPVFSPKLKINASEKQKHYHLKRITHCKSLVDLDDGSYGWGTARLRERFNRIKPKTVEEKNLAEILTLVNNVKKIEQFYVTEFLVHQ